MKWVNNTHNILKFPTGKCIIKEKKKKLFWKYSCIMTFRETKREMEFLWRKEIHAIWACSSSQILLFQTIFFFTKGWGNTILIVKNSMCNMQNIVDKPTPELINFGGKSYSMVNLPDQILKSKAFIVNWLFIKITKV